MTKEQIQARMAMLEAEQKKMLEALEQVKANISAFNGAIEDCKYWLEVLGAETKE